MMKRAPGIETVRQRFASANEPVQEVALSPESCGLGGESEYVSIPPQLAKKIAERRQAAETAADFGAMPQAGQIVRMPTANAAEPTAVLLDTPLKGAVWHGWMVSRDAGYAAEWDFVLGPEDDPRDPFCQLVQVWNPVTPSIADADCVLARLSDERLNAVRIMAKDYARRFVPAPVSDTRMGVILARELSDGTGVVTGTPIGALGDPRREYQDIYIRVGELISRLGLVQVSGVGASPSASATERLVEKERPEPSFAKRWSALIAATISALVFGAITMRFAMMSGMEGVRSDSSIASVDGQKKLAQIVPVFVVQPSETMRISVGEIARIGLSFSVKAVDDGYDLLLEGLIPNSPEQSSVKRILGLGNSAGGDLLIKIRRKSNK